MQHQLLVTITHFTVALVPSPLKQTSFEKASMISVSTDIEQKKIPAVS